MENDVTHYGGPLQSCHRFIFHSTCKRQPYLHLHVHTTPYAHIKLDMQT